jgi:DNA-binding NtrC family response regulator
MRIHVIEDDKVFSRFIESVLQFAPEFEVTPFYNGNDFLVHLEDNPDIVTLDLGLPDLNGEEILNRIKVFNPEIDVIVISGQDDVKVAVHLLRAGAYDYITKDENIKERLRHSVRNIASKKRLKDEISHLKSELSLINTSTTYVGESPLIREVYSLVDKAVKVQNINVSIYGEPGTGKELIARTIHQKSSRCDKPFVKVNVSSIPHDVLESEMFGYENGLFSGASMRRQGKLEEASEGTLFIEEVDELDIEIQSKLLKVLQDGSIMRVGGTKPVQINLRLITASNKDLIEAVRNKTFREDLYFRLMGLPIYLPPLKDRQKDIVLLSKYFLSRFCIENEMEMMKLTSHAQKKLLNYSFPGNIRELKAVIELAAVLTNTGEVDDEHIVFNSSNEVFLDFFSQEMTLKQYNDLIIRHFMEKYNNVIKVAEKLDIGKSTVYNFLKSEKSGFSKLPNN